MSVQLATIPVTSFNSAEAPALNQTDLAELFAQFNEITARLQGTHEVLRSEVSRLESELSQANRELRRSRELAALGEMAAGIAHEVRNPLGSIGLYASMLMDDLADRPDEQVVATKIKRAVQSLDHVVSDVLMFAREIRIQPESNSAIEMINHALEACAESITSAEARIVVQQGIQAQAVIHCDSALVHQALVNVIRNACDAINEHHRAAAGPREVRIAIENRTRTSSQRGREAMTAIIVRDTGSGVSNEAIQRAFNPFFTTRAVGTGLGLAIVHRIMDAHAGGVRIRNAEEGGAIVELLFPAATSQPAVHTDGPQGGDS